MNGDASQTGTVSAPPRIVRERYELGERLEEQSLFLVYDGRDLREDRPVLLKVLRPEFAANASFSRRLEQALREGISLQHPRIVATYDTWRERGVLVFAQEKVAGVSLAERIARASPFPLGVAVDIAVGVAEALEAAAHRGLAHGALRPEWITLTPKGQVKVAGFGLGVALTDHSGLPLSARVEAATYLPPEVINGRPPGLTADVYSLGLILHAMLAGEPPFTAESPLALAMKHQNEPTPPLRSVGKDVPRALEGIVLKCLQKAPGDRYPNALVLLQDLRRAQSALRSDRPLDWSPAVAAPSPNPTPALEVAEVASRRSAPPAPTSSGPSWWLLAGVLPAILVVLIGLGYWGVSAITAAPPDVRVPQVIGQSADAAEAALEEAKLNSLIREEYNEKQPDGAVYSAEPLPNDLIKEGGTVTLFVSRGKRPIETPDVVGLSLAEARQAIRDAKLVPGALIEEFNSNVAKGQIISQSPSAMTERPPGAAVDLVVSKGEEPLSQPASVDIVPRTEPAPQPPPDGDGVAPVTQEFDVDIRVPDEGTAPVRVRILVSDLDGPEREVYNRLRSPGEQFTATIQARAVEGRSRVQVFFDDQPAFDKSY